MRTEDGSLPAGIASTRATGVATPQPWLIELTSVDAQDPVLVGGKAAAIARARSAGLATLPGVVLSTAFCDAIDRGSELCGHPAVQEAFVVTGGQRQRLVARSSSPGEDQATSSMAGQFQSVLGTSGLEEFEAAVQAVLDSRGRAGAAGQPIAVLVQPLLEPVLGGVTFGIDPVTGRSDRRVVTAVAGSPAPLVSGEADGSLYVVDDRARVLECDRSDGPEINRVVLRRLVGLVERAAEVLGGPQDVEWAIDRAGRLWLLQSRPVTCENRGIPAGPLYGPGPVAETFPEPLSELEHDLWVPPLREGVRQATLLAGTATEAELARTEVVVAIGGRVAIDLRLAGEIQPARTAAHRLNPLPAARKLRSAWRVGRLRAALPRLAERLLDRVDADLEAVPALDTLTNRQLVALLYRGQGVLRSLHSHEILIGMLTDPGCGRLTGASVALRVLWEARRDGLDDDTILLRSPVVLALTAPAVRPKTVLPAGATAPDQGQSCRPTSDSGVLREALRLRTRWVQELTGRAAWVVGERLAERGYLPDSGAVRHLSLAEVEALVTRRAATVPRVIAAHAHQCGEALPACFQVSDRGRAIIARRSNEAGGGTGAGGGVGTGPVTFDVSDPPPGSVLVATTLAPGLGPVLPRLNGIVAETGSVLSHLAILAREFGVPIVVGYPGATTAFRDGVVVTVNGDSGDVVVGENRS